MRAVLERVDAWCRRGDHTVADLAWYRIIYCVIALLSLPRYGGIAEQPAAQFDPPPGPIELFGSVPPRAALEALELAAAVLVVFLLMGFKTKAVSLLLAVVMMTGAGLSFSFGKIDHGIFVILVPLVLAFSGWGGARSVDAHLAARDGRPPIEPSQWAVRLLAFMMGLAYLTAGLAKLRSGWLDPHTHAARGHFVEKYVEMDRDELLAPLFLRIHEVGLFWEALDWFTVALECGFVIAVLWWRTLRLAVACAALFHLGVLLIMNIQFSANTIAYGAFVRWGLVLPSGSGRGVRLSGSAAATVGVGLGVGLHVLNNSDLGDRIPSVGGRNILVLGAVVAIVFLFGQAWLAVRTTLGWVRARRSRRTATSPP